MESVRQRVRGVQEARAAQGALRAQQHHLDLAGLTALRAERSSQSRGSYSCCPAPVLREAPSISCLERRLISCEGGWGSQSLRRTNRGLWEDGIRQVAGLV